jgi:hypothetical protein
VTQFFGLRPDPAGHLGDGAVVRPTDHGPVVELLHYVFDNWSGDQIVRAFPCYLVARSLATEFRRAGLTGFDQQEFKLDLSADYRERHPQLVSPDFVWLTVSGTAGSDDFGIGDRNRLIVSQRALDLIIATRPTALETEPFPR